MLWRSNIGGRGMTPEQFQDITDAARAQIEERLGIRARSFRRAVERAGRLLPAGARQAASSLLEIEARMRNPKLASRVDPSVAREALTRFSAQMRGIEPGKRQAMDRAVFWAEIGFRAAVFLALLIGFLVWRGYI
ncbi:hypothetical protein D9R08_02775 [Rhodophyticola porphyridii]|uniref:Uncharacterized protein n=2 Tax=Rhodophyticola porphyridii TaxID=1852017 RepID=A0A3L9YCW5_9RHOB|nr:hypothetical protein D9R08_02775 [Rhodophyticola porphyridii]